MTKKHRERLKKYLVEGVFCSFKGRSRRLAILAYVFQLCLWIFFLTFFAGGIYFMDLLINSPISNQILPLTSALMLIKIPIIIVGTILMAVFILWALVTGCALMVRRLHDMNMSGLLVIFALIPYINIIFFLSVLFIRGTRGKNQYGPDPRL